jgi:hypothetical protein
MCTPSLRPQDSQRRQSGSKARRGAAAGGSSRAASLLEWWFSKPPMQSRPVLLGAEPPRKIEPKVSGAGLAWHSTCGVGTWRNRACLPPLQARCSALPTPLLGACICQESTCLPARVPAKAPKLHHAPSPLLPSASPSPLTFFLASFLTFCLSYILPFLQTFFANERTFLSWLHMAVTIGSISTALLGFAGSAQGPEQVGWLAGWLAG